MSLRLFLFLIVLLIIDLYAFQSVRFFSRGLPQSQIKTAYAVYIAISVFCFGLIIAANIFNWHEWNKAFRTYSFAIIFIIFISKLVVDCFLVIDDLIRIARWSSTRIISMASTSPEPASVKNGISRSAFLVKLALLAGSVPFFSLIYGMVHGAYNFRKRKINLTFNQLPKSFNGFRMVHISDLHTGSFTGEKPLRNAVKMINEMKPDIIFFTGDLVNDSHAEALPYFDILKEMKAGHGIFSIFGNHDYGDYKQWESPHEKQKNLIALTQLHKKLGWDLLLDEYRYIEKDGERISVIGVQNWSARRGFQRYGNIKKATAGLTYSPLNILLSHDPSHWKAQITDHYPQIDLTLSGHTHGMQFGIEIPGFKWSPAQYFYKEWADLYRHKNQCLYVNRGLGFLAYPGRVGIMPEITLIELRSS